MKSCMQKQNYSKDRSRNWKTPTGRAATNNEELEEKAQSTGRTKRQPWRWQRWRWRPRPGNWNWPVNISRNFLAKYVAWNSGLRGSSASWYWHNCWAENRSRSMEKRSGILARIFTSSGTRPVESYHEIILTFQSEGEDRLEIAEVNMDGLTANLRSMFNGIANNRSIDFEIIHHKDKPGSSLHTDQQRLERSSGTFFRMLSNLRPKAAKYSGYRSQTGRGSGIFLWPIQGSGSRENNRELFPGFPKADGSTKKIWRHV